MKISPINATNFGISKVYQGRNHQLVTRDDAANLFNIENVSDKKVGSKFIFTPKDPEFQDLKILVKENSVLESSDGSKMFNFEKSAPFFTGGVYGSIGVREGKADDNMKNAYTSFWTKGMLDTITNKYLSEETSKIKDDYNFFIPSDGDGTRYRDIAKLLRKGDRIPTKPATIIPSTLNNEQMQLVQGVLVNFAKTGKLDEYVDFIEVQPAQGSAYAFLEGLKDGTIPTDKPIVFSWGDNFSDIDVTKLILDFEKSNTGFSYLALPIEGDRIQSLGAVKINNEQDRIVEKFKEKPNAQEAKEYKVPNTENSYLGVVGPYVLSGEVLEWIKNEYSQNPESFHDEAKGYDFSSMILGRLVEPMKNGEIIGANGEPQEMKVYPKPSRDTWSDLGAEKDFSQELKKDFASNYLNMPHEMRTSIMKNKDGFGNIFFNEQSQDTYKRFCDKYGVQFLNAIVYDADSDNI